MTHFYFSSNTSESKGLLRASEVVLVVKKPPAKAGDLRDSSSIPGSGRSPWRRKGQPSPVFLPGKSHGQRNLADLPLEVLF